jgi:phage terminase large subunit-like protein
VTRPALEQLYLLSRELEDRRRDDPWWQWRPTAAQEPFIRSVLVEQHEESWMLAANRSGKSDAAAWIGASLARFGRTCPRYQAPAQGVEIVERPGPTSGWAISRTYPNSIEVIQPKFFANGYAVDPGHAPFIPEREIDSWSATNQLLKLKNGNMVGFKSAEGETMRLAGAAKDWILFDEEPPEAIYEECVIRVGGGRKLLVFGAATLLPPEGTLGGVSWLYERKVKPWQAGRSVGLHIFGASIYDNPYINEIEVRRLESLYPEGSAARAIRLDGEFRPGMQGTRAYSAFDRRIHVRPQPALSARRPLVWALDFNVEPMITIIGQMEGRLFRVYRELVLDDSASVEDMVELFKRIVPEHYGPIWVYGDATGRNRHASTGRSEYALLMNYMGGYGSPVTVKVPEKNPFVADRVNAVNSALRGPNGEISVEIDPSCEELIDDLEQVQRDSKGGVRKTSDRKDRYYRRTHASDALGYWICYERPVRVESRVHYGVQPLTHAREPSYSFRRPA